ncbi:MAG: hypothetical protein WHS38_00670 [Thermodesulforhabdaceae bacterium]
MIDREIRDLSFIISFLGALVLILIAGFLIIMIYTVNVPVALNIDVSMKDGRYPAVVIFERNDISLQCGNLCSSSEELKNALREFCDSFYSFRQLLPNIKSQPELFRQFIETNLDRRRFYLVSIIRPSGVKLFQAFWGTGFSEDLIEQGVPVPEPWSIKVNCK